MSKKEKKAAAKKQKTTGLSINAISMVSFLMFSIVLTAGLYIGQQDPLHTLAEQRQVVADSNARQTALRFTNEFESYTYALHSLAQDPDTIKLFEDKNLQAWQQRETEIKSMFPRTLRVRLLSPTTSQPDHTYEPHFTYACLDLLNQSRAPGLTTHVEMHEIEGKQQHIDMMQAVAQRGKVIGFIQLALDPGLLNEWTKNVAGKTYIEVTQKIDNGKTFLISKSGTVNKEGVHATADIPGANWKIDIWKTFEGADSAFNLGMVFALVVGIVLSAVVVFVLRSLLHKELQSDLEKYLMLVTGTLRGNKATQFEFSLQEFKVAAANAENLRFDKNNMDRERDASDDKNSKSTQAFLPDSDPMFMSKDSISLEELDDTSPIDDLDSLDDTGPATPAANLPALPEEIFKAYDIRGIVGKTLTAENIQLIGQSIGSEAKVRGLDSIVFARDGRLSGAELGQALVKGLLESGINVVDIGMMPTPVLYYAASEMAKGTGVMLTGSHNPPDYNGIKMMLGGETLSGDTIQLIRQRIIKGDLSKGSGSYSNEKMLERYIARIVNDVTLKRKMKIVIDCGNGVAGAVAPALFSKLGCDVTPLFCEVDGKFPNHHPDPSQPENLGDLIAEVKKQNADMGIAFDGDGDRIGVVSGDGKIIWPDRLMMLFARDVISRNPGANIIYDIKCSSNLRNVIEEEGGQPLMWKTGHSLIKAKMKETKALLAGEMSGHIFFKERWYGFDDALYAAARLLEIMSSQLRQPRVVFSSLADSYNTPELKIEMQEGEHFKFIEELSKKSSAFPDAEVTMIDGVRVDYNDGWGLVRASNTTPCLVLRFEGKNRAAMARVQDKFREVLTGIRADIKLPF